MFLKFSIRLILLMGWLGGVALAVFSIVVQDPLRSAPGAESFSHRLLSAAILAALAVPAWMVWRIMRPAHLIQNKRENP